MRSKRNQIYNCCKFIHYLDIVDRNFTLDNYKWLNDFNSNEIFKSYNIELSKNEKEMLKSRLEQIKINHAEEVRIYDEQIHKKAMKSLGELSYMLSLVSGNNHYNDLKGLMR